MADALFAQRLLHRCTLCVAQHIIENPKGQDLLGISVNRKGHIPGQIRLFFLILFRQDAVIFIPLNRSRKGLLRPDFGIHLQDVIVRKVLLIDKAQALYYVHITVEIQIRVGRMVKALVKCQILLVGELWDHLGIAAGDDGIGGIRVERGKDCVV